MYQEAFSRICGVEEEVLHHDPVQTHGLGGQAGCNGVIGEYILDGYRPIYQHYKISSSRHRSEAECCNSGIVSLIGNNFVLFV